MLALDTNVIVDLLRKDEAVRHNYRTALTASTPLWISVFVLQELLFGAELHGNPPRERTQLAPILADLEIVAFERTDAEIGGRVRASMEKRGRRAPQGDFIVGVHALARGTTLVTANTRHFINIPGLTLLDWRQSPKEPQD